MDQQNIIDEAPKFNFLSLLTRTISALGGGIAGTIVLLIVYMLSSSVIQPVLQQTEEGTDVTPFFTVVIMAMVFVSLLAANIFAPLFISFTQGERYTRTSTSLFQIFIVNIVIFVLLVPVYLFATGIEFLAFVAGLQIALAIMGSALIFEVISNYKYSILGIYSVIFALLVSIVFSGVLFQATGSALVLLFLALPLLWGGIGFIFGIIGMIYSWIVSTWGVDYLATTQSYSRDYGVQEDENEVEIVEPEPEDTEGVDFLRK